MIKKLIIVLAIVFSGTFMISSIRINEELKISKGVSLDDFLAMHNPSDRIVEAYRFAYENPDNVLDHAICYCGCIENNGHENSRDCFLKRDGRIDEMGLNCGLCVTTVLDAKEMKSNGLSDAEIRSEIDRRYKRS